MLGRLSALIFHEEIWKSRTYKEKPHNSHVKPFKRKYKDDRGRVKKCKCFICGKERHFAKDCRSKQDNIARSVVYQELDLDDNWDIVSEDFDDSSVYSISEGEGINESNDEQSIEDYYSHHAFMFHPGPPTKIEDMVQSTGSWKPDKELPTQSKSCEHDWKENTVTNYTVCYYCGILTTDMSRLNCPKCQLTTCALCARNYLGKTVNVKGKQPHKPEEEKDFSSNEVRLLKELLKEKTEQVQQMIKDQAKEYYENRAIMQRKEELWQSEKSLLVKDLTDALKIIDQLKTEQIMIEKQKDEEIRKLKAQLQKEKEKETEVRYSSEEFPPLGNPQIARPFMEAEVHYSGNTTTAPKIRKITNQLYNVKVEFEIPNCPMFGTTAIIDTGASACCINKKVIPEDIPLIYAFDMNDNNGIEMLIGANFLRSMKGGIRVEGDEITIYKKVTRIKTSNQTEVAEVAITELGVSEEEFMEINESIYFNQEGSKAFLEQFKPVIERLKHQGYIGEEPLKHWKKNGELCKLDIINPDIKIKDRPLKHVTLGMEDSFKKHVDSLLKIGAIRPCKSRHRTMAMIVNSGTIIDPATGREIKGKERMVFNYKSLNDNTYKDQYSLPGINTIIKRVGGAKIFSKFDLKSGFHQVAMDDIDNTQIFIHISNQDSHFHLILGICFIIPNFEDVHVQFQGKEVNFNEEELKTKKGLRPLYEKTNAHGDKRVKSSDYELIRKIKEHVQSLPDLEIPPKSGYIILETDEVTLRTYFQAIISFYNKTNSNKSSRVRWIKFADAVTGPGVKINIEHIEGKHNTLADSLSRLVNLCFAECMREMKQLAATTLYSMEEVLQSPNAFQKNMKITCEEIMRISNHFQESSQKLSSHMKNQEHYTDITSSRPTKAQSEWINLMHGD
ncbi:Orf y [Tanacetum coccineum]